MTEPNPLTLDRISESEVLEIVVTGALRDDHWLHRDGVLTVADSLEARARALYPKAVCAEAHGLIRT